MDEHPFADLIDLVMVESRAGHCEQQMELSGKHLNPHGVAHGAVLFAMADTGMGGALYPTLAQGEICATIEIKINYFKPVRQGILRCVSELVNRGKTVANIESSVFLDDQLVAKASGNYAIFRPGGFESTRSMSPVNGVPRP
jgi:acyl-CoA thioesterase